MTSAKLVQVQSMATLNSDDFDALVVVAHDFTDLPTEMVAAITAAQRVNANLTKGVAVLACDAAPAQCLILAPTGALNRDFDDVRRYYDAARSAAAAAVQAGASKPLIWVAAVPQQTAFAHAIESAWFGFAQGLHEPLEAREFFGADVEPVQQVGIITEGKVSVDWLQAVEDGRRVARDLCGTEPERMSPLRFAEYCQKAFTNTSVKVTVIDDKPQLEHEYPLLAAVGRASFGTSQRPCVVRLEYLPEGDIDQTLLLVGKGITYDTGGADLKTGGHMAGM